MKTTRTISRTLTSLAAIIMLVIMSAAAAEATPARQVMRTLSQPDGTTFTAILKGDESLNWYETDGGYAIVIDGNSDWWHYVADIVDTLPGKGKKYGLLKQLRDGKLKKHAFRVGKHNPAGRMDLLRDIGSLISTGSPLTDDNFGSSTAITAAFGDIRPAPNTARVLWTVFNFVDSPMALTEAQFNDRIYGSGTSLASWVDEATHGKTAVIPAPENYGTDNDGSLGIIPVPNPYSIYNCEARDSLTDINDCYARFLSAAFSNRVLYQPDLDYTPLDIDGSGVVEEDEAVVVMFFNQKDCSYAPEPYCVWPRIIDMKNSRYPGPWEGITVERIAVVPMYTGDETLPIGPLTHEMGHLIFGWPDMYDADGTSDGLGNFDVMATGSWCAAPGAQPGTMPVHPSAYLKLASGIIDEDVIIDGDWFVELPAAASAPVAKKVETGRAGEFFLVENRATVGFDRGLAGCLSMPLDTGGLLVMHADTAIVGMTDETRKQVDIEEADAVQHLDATGNGRGRFADLFAADVSADTFSDATSPSARRIDGTATGVLLHGISAAGTTMRLHMGDTPIVPALTPSPSMLDFGNVITGFADTRDLTVTNTGNRQLVVESVSTAAPFSVETFECTVMESGESCTWSITFAPAAIAPATGELTIASNDPFTPTAAVTLAGTGTPNVPDVNIEPTSVDFGVVPVGSRSPDTYITIDNLGTSELSVIDAAITGDTGAFTLQDSCTTVAPGGSCAMAVSFAPAASGSVNASLVVTTNDPDEAAVSVNLTGTGVVYEPVMTLSTTIHDFGLVTVGSAASVDIVIGNAGNAALDISGITIGGTNPEAFAVDSACASVAPGDTCTAAVTFTPETGGAAAASLVIDANDPGGRSVALVGEGYLPEGDIDATPAIIDFGQVRRMNLSADETITVSNTGDAPIDVTDVSLTGQGAALFILINSCAGLEAGESCTITARFAPLAVEASEALVAIESTDPDEPVIYVTLRGEGVKKTDDTTDTDDATDGDSGTDSGTGNGNGNGTGEAGGGCSAGEAPVNGSFAVIFIALALRMYLVRRRG